MRCYLNMAIVHHRPHRSHRPYNTANFQHRHDRHTQSSLAAERYNPPNRDDPRGTFYQVPWLETELGDHRQIAVLLALTFVIR